MINLLRPFNVTSMIFAEVQLPISIRGYVSLKLIKFNWILLGFIGISSVFPAPALATATPTTATPTTAELYAESRDPRHTPFSITIEAVEWDGDRNQILIRSTRSLSYTTRWQGNEYQIILPSARLAESVETPELAEDSPIEEIRLTEGEDDTVIISIRLALNTRIGQVNLVTPEDLVVQLERTRPIAITPISPDEDSPSETTLPTSVAGTPLPTYAGEERIVVVIDPGHGGIDPGAVGIDGLREVDVIFPISLEVMQLLEEHGIQVVLTRNDNRTLELETRAQIANRVGATLFVSIHANAISMSRPDVNGAETYYFSTGEGLAASIQRSILATVEMNNRGVKRARFFVLRRTSMPSALVEVGFVTGAEDAPRLADPAFRSLLAEAIARGILEYVVHNY
jgi:N-acetylmuramoyl-L-alanine amidase